MIKHISIFFLKEEQREEHKRILLACMDKMEEELEGQLCGYYVGADCMERPPKGLPGLPEFGDVVQEIDFKDETDAIAYPNHPAHIQLTKQIGGFLEKVVAIDIECRDGRCRQKIWENGKDGREKKDAD